MNDKPKWRRFEELVEHVQRGFVDGSAKVVGNDKILGNKTKVLRQVDVSIRQRVGTYDILVAIECKDLKDPVDVKGVEEFKGLVEDIGANKAAIVSASGFTDAAKARALEAGIDVLRLVDAEDHEWQTYVTIPTLITDHRIKGYSLRFEGTGYFEMDPVDDWRRTPFFREDGTEIGIAENLLVDRWEDGTVPKTTGAHVVKLTDEETWVKGGGKFWRLSVTAEIHVETVYFFGQLPLTQVQGFHDEITGATKTKGFTTAMISFPDVELEKDWKRISAEEVLAVKPAIGIVVSTVPEKRFGVAEPDKLG